MQHALTAVMLIARVRVKVQIYNLPQVILVVVLVEMARYAMVVQLFVQSVVIFIVQIYAPDAAVRAIIIVLVMKVADQEIRA